MANKNKAAIEAARAAAAEAKARKAASTPAAAEDRPEMAGAKAPAAIATGPDGLPALPRMKRTRKAKSPRACACGCGGDTRGGRFIPGHDAKLAGWALRVERGLIALADIPHDGIRSAVAGVMATAKARPEAPDPEGDEAE